MLTRRSDADFVLGFCPLALRHVVGKTIVAFLAFAFFLPQLGSGQSPPKKNFQLKPQEKGTGLPSNVRQETVSDVVELELTSRFHIVSGSRKGYLIVKARIPNGSYIYSLTQGGDIPPTAIQPKKNPKFKVNGKFAADRTAEVIPFDRIMKTRVEKHKRLVQFYVPIELNPGVDPAKLRPEVLFETQICSDLGMCKPIRNRKLTAKFGGYFQQSAKSKKKNEVKKR